MAEITQDMTCPRVTDLPLLEPPAPLKGRENIPSLGKKETTPVGFHLFLSLFLSLCVVSLLALTPRELCSELQPQYSFLISNSHFLAPQSPGVC